MPVPANEFQACENKAFAWLKANSLATYFWRDQGHHSHCLIWPHKVTGRCASYAALYMLRYLPADQVNLDEVRELARFAEDRHVVWDRSDPKGAQAGKVAPYLEDANPRESGSSIWMGSRLALVQLLIHRRRADPLLLAKATALMDAITHAQHPVQRWIDQSMTQPSAGLGETKRRTNWGQCAMNLVAFADLLEGGTTSPTP